jgi:drug/metabolite transporter (DMT)-like permease
MSPANKQAPLIALAAAALFGLSTPLAKMLLGGMSPWLRAGLLYLGSGLGLFVLILLRRALGKAAGEAGLAKHDLPWLAGTVLFGGVLGPLLLLYGLMLTDAASTSLLLNLEAVFTLGLAWVVFGEHVDARLFAGALAIVAGCASFMAGERRASFLGRAAGGTRLPVMGHRQQSDAQDLRRRPLCSGLN